MAYRAWGKWSDLIPGIIPSVTSTKYELTVTLSLNKTFNKLIIYIELRCILSHLLNSRRGLMTYFFLTHHSNKLSIRNPKLVQHK